MIIENTKKMVDELQGELNKHDIKACALHGDMKQEFRSRVMEQFRSGSMPILIGPMWQRVALMSMMLIWSLTSIFRKIMSIISIVSEEPVVRGKKAWPSR